MHPRSTCSGLEDSRLNYIEQHAQRLGLDQGVLEANRVAASQGSSVGDALDVCARHMTGATLTEMAPKLSGLVRRGVGLNTRAGTGKFVSTVVRRLRSDAAPAAPQLMRALVEACKSDPSKAVKKAYASANALLSKFAAPARVQAAVGEWLAAYVTEDADANTRYVSGLLLHELAREANDVFVQHVAAIGPVAYMAQVCVCIGLVGGRKGEGGDVHGWALGVLFISLVADLQA
jgi:proteasome component ECM29